MTNFCANLPSIQVHQLNTIIAFAHDRFKNDRSGHGFDHLKRVAKLAFAINKKEHADQFLVLTTAFLHDICDDKLTSNPQKQLASCQQLLEDCYLPKAHQNEIITNITRFGFANNLESTQQLTLSGQIAQDADWLDALGAMGVGRAFYYGGKFGEEMFDPNIVPRKNMTRGEYRNLQNETIINHFSEKLFVLEDMLFTNTAKIIAAKRTAFMRTFVEQFKAEYFGDDY